MKFKGIVNAGECACGKEHGVNLDSVSVGHGVLEEIPEIAKRFSAGGRVELICDGNTFEAAGLRIKQYLDAQDVPSSICELHPRDHVVPDEKTVGDARASVSKDTRVLLVVGSGTITDITRIIAHEKRVPFIWFPRHLRLMDTCLRFRPLPSMA